MNKKTTLFAITMIAAMPLIIAQAKPIKAEEITTQQNNVQTNERKIEFEKMTAARKAEFEAKAEARKAEFETKNAERAEIMVQKKDALAQKKCEVAQKRISLKTSQLENNRKMYQTVYGNMHSRLERLVARLDSAGLDTAKLKTDLVKLNEMTAQLQMTYSAFIGEFNQAEAAACDKTIEQFKSQFEGVRAQVAEIKTLRAQIKDFFNSTIKPDLQALKSQLDEEKAENTASKTTEILN